MAWEYKNRQDLMEHLQFEDTEDVDWILPGDESITSEGRIIYVHSGGEWLLFKCKPHSVEEIHWVNGKGSIGRSSIIATSENYLEGVEVLNFEKLEPLLLEEYSQEFIDKSKDLIIKCISEINECLDFDEKVMNSYRRQELDFSGDKGGTMRAMSKEFSRGEMSKVHAVLLRIV